MANSCEHCGAPIEPTDTRCSHCGVAVRPADANAPAATASTAVRLQRALGTPAYEAALRHVPRSAAGRIVFLFVFSVIVMVAGVFFAGITLGVTDVIDRIFTGALEHASTPSAPAPEDVFHGEGRAASLRSFASGIPFLMRVFLVLFGAGFFVMGASLFRRAVRFARASPVPVLSAVQDKRVEEHQRRRGRSSTSYFATFETQDGVRREAEIEGEMFGQLVAGDVGVAFWRSDVVVDFVRLEAR